MIRSCLIGGNLALGDGGGLSDCDGTVSNCTVYDNEADVDCDNDGDGGGLYGCGGTIKQCIIWANTAYSDDQLASSSDPTYSCIEDYTGSGTGNIDDNPGLVDANGADNSISTWDDNNLHLDDDSPCINAGDPNFSPDSGEQDIDGDGRVALGYVDMGADEVNDSTSLKVQNVNKMVRYLTIQGAIDDASAGDAIIVYPGTFSENIDFDGKDIILRSTDPYDSDVVAATIVDGGDNGSVVTFDGTETSSAVLSGFTIRNGSAANGGGIDGGTNGTGATISHCVIWDNEATTGNGGGLYKCDGNLTNCMIIDNTAGTDGGGLYDCHGNATNCVIAGNEAEDDGGGLYDCDGDIINCTIYGNIADNDNDGGAGGGLNACGGTIKNCIVWANKAYQTGSQLVSSSDPTYSCIEGYAGSGTGNLTNDPALIDPSNENYHLVYWSPCIDAGDSSGNYSSQIDIDGVDRELDGDGDDTATVDMGADELSRLTVCSAGADYEEIQDAIDAAKTGTVIVVCEGTYVENIDFDGKQITLVSLDPDDPHVVDGTTIDGGGATNTDSVVTFDGAESSATMLLGFTITNGQPSGEGGGIQGNGTSATIAYCLIEGNTATSGGGLHGCDGLISNCTIADNCASGSGGGLYGCDGTVRNSTVVNNEADGDGGGLHDCDGTVINCTVHYNVSDADNDGDTGGGFCGCGGTIKNCIIWDNKAYQTDSQLASSSTPDYSCIEGWSSGGTGNTASDPNFVDENGGDDDLSTWSDNDLHLSSTSSPCVDTGGSGSYTDQTDIDGQSRVFDGDDDQTDTIDMGADEYVLPELDDTEGDPTGDGTIPKTQNNVILLVFDEPLVLPPSGDPVTIKEDLTGTDKAGDFNFSLSTTYAVNDTLKCQEDGQKLTDQKWYRIEPTTAFIVGDFDFDFCTLRGDANNSGRVTTADYSAIGAHDGETTNDDPALRWDIDGDGTVEGGSAPDNEDILATQTYIGNQAPARP